MGSEPRNDFPKIDFSDLDYRKPEGENWESVRAQLMEALHTYGFFQPTYNKLKPEFLDELFGPVAKQLFEVPYEAKLKTASHRPYQGFIQRTPGIIKYESLAIEDAGDYEAVEAFSRLMWPEGGNQYFCEKMWNFNKNMSELERIVQRMVLQSLGLGKYFDAFVASAMQTLRITDYDSPTNEETMMAMVAHTDMNILTMIYQHDKEGLEVKSKTGEWFRAEPRTITVFMSESMEAWSNGRLKATTHQVRLTSNEKRYSVGFGSQFRYGHMIEAPEELINEKNPKLYKPYDYDSYLSFRFSEKGWMSAEPLKDFCGVAASGGEVAY